MKAVPVVRRHGLNMKNVGLGGNGGNMPGQQVSFQRKNPDFLLNNPDFLLKNVDCITNHSWTRVTTHAIRLRLGSICTPHCVTINDEFALKPKKLCIKNEEFCITNDEFCSCTTSQRMNLSDTNSALTDPANAAALSRLLAVYWKIGEEGGNILDEIWNEQGTPYDVRACEAAGESGYWEPWIY